MEMNPHHPVTEQLHEHWHKIAALIMRKAGLSKLTITLEDSELFGSLPPASMPTILVHSHKDSMDVLLMPLDEARRYAEKLGQSF
jgi:hypothetical protein